MNEITIGIDVSKDFLDAHRHGKRPAQGRASMDVKNRLINTDRRPRPRSERMGERADDLRPLLQMTRRGWNADTT